MKQSFLVLVLALILALVFLAGCSGGSSGSGGAGNGGGNGTAIIAVSHNNSNPTGFAFQSPVTVKSGATVQWANGTGAPHGITWDAQVPNTSPAPGANIPVFNGGAKSQAYTAPVVTTQTTYNYHCTVHGPQMAGQLIVTP